jgi:hypothetical protein
LLNSGKWSELLQKKAFTLYQKMEEKLCEVDTKNASNKYDSINSDFDAGDEVLVQSIASGVLWDANIVVVAKRDEGGPIIAYRMHYKEWSSRFDEWVAPSRVLEVSDENIEKQVSSSSRLLKPIFRCFSVLTCTYSYPSKSARQQLLIMIKTFLLLCAI